MYDGFVLGDFFGCVVVDDCVEVEYVDCVGDVYDDVYVVFDEYYC